MSFSRLATTGLLLASVSALYAADASAAIRQALKSESLNPHFWGDRAAFDARPQPRGAFATFGGDYATLNGRQVQIGEGRIGITPLSTLTLWYDHQSFKLLGRHSGNELNVQADNYGVKWVAMPGKSLDDPSLAFEATVTEPGRARAHTSNSSAVFVHTDNFGIAAIYGPWKGYQARLAYDHVGAGGDSNGDAHIVNLALARDWDLGHKFNLRGQVHLVNQSYSDIVESKDFDLKPYFYAAIGYDATSFLRVEANGTLFTNGMPMGGTNYTGVSSFLIYRPGGIAESLRNDAIGFASLRVMFHKSF